jgi:hypothetical protein
LPFLVSHGGVDLLAPPLQFKRPNDNDKESSVVVFLKVHQHQAHFQHCIVRFLHSSF